MQSVYVNKKVLLINVSESVCVRWLNTHIFERQDFYLFHDYGKSHTFPNVTNNNMNMKLKITLINVPASVCYYICTMC